MIVILEKFRNKFKVYYEAAMGKIAEESGGFVSTKDKAYLNFLCKTNKLEKSNKRIGFFNKTTTHAPTQGNFIIHKCKILNTISTKIEKVICIITPEVYEKAVNGEKSFRDYQFEIFKGEAKSMGVSCDMSDFEGFFGKPVFTDQILDKMI